jgi:hypothetical protein
MQVYIYVGVPGLSVTSIHALRFVCTVLHNAENTLWYISFMLANPFFSYSIDQKMEIYIKS